jgi:succinate-semialdehyde dehydrogenase/glutarate-semialdehyde dehydrogenase
LEDKLIKADIAFKSWKNVPLKDKLDLIERLGKSLVNNKQKLAELMTLEMGKPISQSFAEIDKCVLLCNYYIENAESFLRNLSINTSPNESYVNYQPLGVILAVMPWNFPFWQVFRFAVPSLLAGNTGVLKHSNNTSGCALEIEKLFLEAGFPESVFTTLMIDVDPVLDIIKYPVIRAVTFTGSTRIGRLIAQTAGSVIKKSVLELGGSDPYIVLKDADVKQAAKSCVISRMINNGQSCIAAKRFIIDELIFDEFLECFKSEISNYKYNNPLSSETNYGPIARKDLLESLKNQLQNGLKDGAELLFQNNDNPEKGFYFPPTIVMVNNLNNLLFQEETFGPIASFYKFKNEEEAFSAANSTEFGLGAAIFSADIEKAKSIAEKHIDSGSVFINDFVKSDPRLPFGGIKYSGFGRELSEIGIKEFVNIKSISIKK